MKIAHYINNLGSGGAEKLLSDILPIMVNDDNEVHLIVSNNEKSVGKYLEILKENNIKIHDLKTSFYNPFQIIKVIKIIKKENFNILHAHLFPSQYWLSIASFFISKKTKLIKTEHSVFNERRNSMLFKPIEKLIYSRYKKIICISTLVKQSLQKWVGFDDKMVIINNGVNLSQIYQSHSNINSDDYKFINSSKFNILMVGRFDTFLQKDQANLVHAMQLLDDSYHLYFAGEGGNFDTVKKLVDSLNLSNQVSFLGLRQDVYTLMYLVDLNVLSTNHEGFSGVTLESLASKKPFIGSDVVGVQDVVPNESFLFPAKNPEQLAEKIIEIKNNEIIQQNNIETALKHIQQYDIHFMSKNYIKIYKDALS